MSLILNIETATTVCSVALFDGNSLLGYRELNDGYTHAENLHVFVQQVFAEANRNIPDLSAVAVSKGPGSYTGLRIGSSAAKGLAFALKIPLISIDTLTIMAEGARRQMTADFYCPMIDARRMEVYCSVLDKDLVIRKSISAEVITSESLEQFESFRDICFFGDGMEKCRPLLMNLKEAKFLNDALPTARSMGRLSYSKFIAKEFEDTAYFEPFYLKEFIAGKKKS